MPVTPSRTAPHLLIEAARERGLGACVQGIIWVATPWCARLKLCHVQNIIVLLPVNTVLLHHVHMQAQGWGNRSRKWRCGGLSRALFVEQKQSTWGATLTMCGGLRVC
jgi:hypothetical protein